MASKYATQSSEPNRSETTKFLCADGSWKVPEGSGGASSLEDLTDVNIQTPTDHQALVYDETSDKWINGDVATEIQEYTQEYFEAHEAEIRASGEVCLIKGTGSPIDTSLGDLSDVSVAGAADGNILMYNGSTSKWAKSNCISDIWVNTTNYSVGALVIYNNILYKCITSNTGMQPDENPTYWSATNIGNELKNINSLSSVRVCSVTSLISKLIIQNNRSRFIGDHLIWIDIFFQATSNISEWAIKIDENISFPGGRQDVLFCRTGDEWTAKNQIGYVWFGRNSNYAGFQVYCNSGFGVIQGMIVLS